MKNILHLIQNREALLFSEIKNKKMPMHVKNAFGVTLQNEGITDSEYLKIRDRIDKFKKDRVRYQTDGTKIVIERHVADNVLAHLDKHIIIKRSAFDDRDGLYTFNLREEHRLQFYYDTYLGFSIFVGIFICLLVWLGCMMTVNAIKEHDIMLHWPSVIISSAAGFLYFFFTIKHHLQEKKKRNSWLADNLEYRPLEKLASSKKFNQAECHTIDCTLDVKLNDNDDKCRKWHKEVALFCLSLAGDMKAKTAWLCASATPFQIVNPAGEYKSKYTRYFNLQLLAEKDNMIPMIVTDSAYIFHFPDHPDPKAFIDCSENWEDKISKLFETENEKLLL